MRHYLNFILAFCFGITTFAQTPQLKELELTTSPAFVLMGVQPTNIQRPSTPRDFVAGLQSSTVNGSLQPNFAMETNPFNWNKKNVNTHSFVGNDYFSNKMWPAIKKNFALSLATSTSDTIVFGDLRKGTGLGYGMRVTLIPGTVNKKTTNAFQEWALAESKETFVSFLKAIIDADTNYSYEDILYSYNQVLVHLHSNKNIPDYLKPSIEKELFDYKENFSSDTKEDLITKLNEEKKSLRNIKTEKLDNINKRKVPFAREGFILELTYAGVTVLQDNKWKEAVYAKTGVWLTPSYRFDLSSDKDPELIQSIDILAIGRYLWNDKNVDKGNYLDFGAKAQFNRNDWNLSFEGVFRRASDVPANVNSNWTYSWISNLNYTIQENITLKVSFGSKFDGNTRTYTSPNEIVAIGGINFGFLK